MPLTAAFGLLVIGLFVLVAVFAPLLAPYGYATPPQQFASMASE